MCLRGSKCILIGLYLYSYSTVIAVKPLGLDFCMKGAMQMKSHLNLILRKITRCSGDSVLPTLHLSKVASAELLHVFHMCLCESVCALQPADACLRVCNSCGMS